MWRRGSAGVLRQHGVEHLRHDLLPGLGKLAEGIELLFEPGGRAASCTGLERGWRGLAFNQCLDGHGEHAGKTGKHRHGNAATADLVEGGCQRDWLPG